MDYKKTITACVAMLAMPMLAMAQANIQKAFETFTASKDVEVAAQHSMTKDPDTGKKEGQLDIYTYTLPKQRKALLKGLEAAFQKDMDKAYSCQSGTNSDGKADESLSLAIGDDRSDYVMFAQEKGMNYLCLLFYDPEEAKGKYRYAYVMEWMENDEVVTGRLIVTYATSQKYRTEQRQKRNQILVGINDVKDSGSWLGEFGIYLKKLQDNPNSSSGSIYVNQVYNLCKRAQALSDSEKNLVATELTKIQEKITDDFTKGLLTSAIENLKK